MNRADLEKYILENYNAETDFPWIKYPSYQVFRHKIGRKWFALVMEIPKNKLGLKSDEIIQVVNFKCESILIGSLRKEEGFYPAYHMNKDSWITAALDGSVPDDKIKMLLDMSFDMIDSKIKK